MFSIIISTKNNEEGLARTLAALVPAAIDGIVSDVVVVDCGSQDSSRDIALSAGCHWIEAIKREESPHVIGAHAAKRGDWLLFLEPGVVVNEAWREEIRALITNAQQIGKADQIAIVFNSASDKDGWYTRLWERIINICHIFPFGISYSYPGFSLSRRFYEDLTARKSLNKKTYQTLLQYIRTGCIIQMKTHVVTIGMTDKNRKNNLVKFYQR